MKKLLCRLLLICLIVGVVPLHFSSATDTTDELQKELDSLTAEASSLSEEIAIITNELQFSSEQLLQTRQELALAKGKLEDQYEAMKSRIKYMYENGDYALMEIILGSRSTAIVMNRLAYFEAINKYDQDAIDTLLQTQEEIEQREAELISNQERLTALQATLAEKESALYGQIELTSAELAEAQARIAEAKAESEAAQQQASQPVDPIKPIKPERPNISQEESVGDVSEEDLLFFAALIECEAGSTNYDGMLAVASVVINRMKSPYYPDTLRGVMCQSGQFPPSYNGLVAAKLERGVKDSCLRVAKDALAGKNNVGDCLSFRAASSGHAGKIIGDNVFF